MQLTDAETAFKEGMQALMKDAEGEVRIGVMVALFAGITGGQIGLDADDEEQGVEVLNIAATIMSNAFNRARKVRIALDSEEVGHA